MKEYIVDNFSALIGIDWADKKHDICELDKGTGKYQYSIISTKLQAIHFE